MNPTVAAPAFLSAPPEVRIINRFERPFDNAVATARTCYSGRGIVYPEQVAPELARDEEGAERRRELRDRIARSIYRAGHHTTFQHAHVQFALANVSRHFIWGFLHSHPFYNSEQVSQRYVEVREGAVAVPPLEGEALEIYRATVGLQGEAYARLNGLLHGTVQEAYLEVWPYYGRIVEGKRCQSVIQKKTQEVARYVLPVATLAYLYHTVSALTLLRYWRSCLMADTPLEQRLVVGRMVELLLEADPDYATVLQEPLPPEAAPEFPYLQDAAGALEDRRAFAEEFDRRLGGRVSLLVDRKGHNEEVLADAVREVLGKPRGALSDDEAIRLALDPAANALLGESLNLRPHGKLTRALVHPSYTFARRLSHTADSQDQRHRMTPASRPTVRAYLTDGPDYVTPVVVRRNREALALYDETMARTWDAIARLRVLGAPEEFAAYILPNAVALRYTESADLAALHHKHAMRLCYNAQEEIWRASLDEAEQIREVEPRIGRWLLPPCGLRARSGTRPVCPEGDRFCGVRVWKLDLKEYRRTL
ncbi:MAG: FAD-dependent thymidylate synthase [Planctomycetes bacterium]|nr:FAD-dependent thymidylate synthase [Planctomycetota bacterium]